MTSARETFGAWRRRDFGERLRGLIKARGISPNRFARNVGIDSPRVASWIKGARPTDDYMERLSEEFGVSVEWLLVGDAAQRERPTGTLSASRAQ